MMAVSAWWVWRRRSESRVGPALGLFGVQLALNVAWSAIFFGLRRPDLAFVEILFLWAAIVATVVAFARVSRGAAALLLPYLAWVSFAVALNLAVWRLNP
jgi:tryptophan-rich sensory protein